MFRFCFIIELCLFENNPEHHCVDSAGSCRQKDKDGVQYVPCERAGGGPQQLSQRLHRGSG